MGDSGYSQYIVEDYLDPETQTIVSAKYWEQAVRRYCLAAGIPQWEDVSLRVRNCKSKTWHYVKCL